MTAALEYARIFKRFGGTTALTGASFGCPPASVTALIGPNGAGKSTLFLAAAGLLEPDFGSVRVLGHPAGSAQAQSAVSLMPEQPDLYPGVSVWEHVVFIALLHRLSGWESHAEQLLERFGLAERRDELPHQLSQGLRRRLALVMALLRGADVLLLDEPFNGLDPRSAHELRSLVRELADAGASVLVATHILSDVERLADWVVVLDHGATRAAGTPDQLRLQAGVGPGEDLEAAYLALTEAA
jgi:ABC-2 type transport system ATP-binding protein